MEVPPESNKKTSMEDLTKEELVKKCKTLLQITDTAKQTKNTLIQEKNPFQEHICDTEENVTDTNRELIENLTHQKLELVSTISKMEFEKNTLLNELKQCHIKLSDLEDRLGEMDTQNQSFQRQIQRLNGENTSLLINLNDLEVQMKEVKNINYSYQKELAVLHNKNINLMKEHAEFLEMQKKLQENIVRLQKEDIKLLDKDEPLKNTEKHEIERTISNELDENTNDSEILLSTIKDFHQNISYLMQKNEKLTVENSKLIEENDSIHSQNQELIHTASKLKKIVSEYENTIIDLNRKNKEKDQQIENYLNSKDDLNTELHKNRALIEKLQQDLNSTAGKLADNQIVCSGITTDLQNTNEKLKEKLKSYHSKIVKFAKDVKNLKDLKDSLINYSMKYILEAQNWQKQLEILSNVFVNDLNKIRNENVLLLKENATFKEMLVDTNKNNESLVKENEKLKQDFENISLNNIQYENKIGNINQDNEQLIENISKLDNEVCVLKESTNKESIEEHYLMNKQFHSLKIINDTLENEIQLLREKNKELDNEVEKKNADVLVLKQTNDELQLEVFHLKNIQLNDKSKINVIDTISLENESFSISKTEKNNLQELCDVKTEKHNKDIEDVHMQKQLLELQDINKMQLKEINECKQHNEYLIKELGTLKTAEIGLAEQSRREIVKLNEEIHHLTKINEELQENLKKNEKLVLLSIQHFKETQTDDDLNKESELEETVSILKREHNELLSEMNLMNQELKERGEIISKQEEHCEELLKKIKVFEIQSSKTNEIIQAKEEIISQLQTELQNLKQFSSDHSSTCEENRQLNSVIDKLRQKISLLDSQSHETCDNEIDSMSVSTISKAEELSRLKDLEGSWEEKYGKLRSLAIKLKGKVRDLEEEIGKEQKEKVHLQQKYSNSIKTSQMLQTKCDKLEDELDSTKTENIKLSKKLDSVVPELSSAKKQLSINEELINELKHQVEALTKEKDDINNWKRQVGGKVQTLRKEIEANSVLKKNFENQISRLKADLELKENELKKEIELHSQTKSLLQESSNECKKQSVLNLEMQDYERGLKDLSQKLEKKQEIIQSIKAQVESQKTTSNALKEQNRVLEERYQLTEADLDEARKRINAHQKNINSLEAVVINKDEKITELTSSIENLRLQNEELSAELSKVIAEHQKANLSLKSEKEYLRSQNLGLEQRLREVQDMLNIREEELNLIQMDYQNYKVRAQSVLKQNQNRDVAQEEKLSHELSTSIAQIEVLTQQLNESKIALKKLTEENANLILEKEKVELGIKQMKNEVDDYKKQLNEMSCKYHLAVSEHSDSIRNLKIHLETVTQCYKQQLSEQEVRHNREIIELQSKLEKENVSPENHSAVHPIMPREEGEGSESVDSINIPTTYPVPLERLLNNEFDQEVMLIRKQLAQNDAKVLHLTALLSDTEQDLAKHVQMNRLLKEEIRRQQRSVEREKHAENLEYLKNIIFKFVTLSNGDERSRLVPVLNTILKFSKEEIQKLNEVARGEHGLRGWSIYLPTWTSSPNKPQ